MIQSMTGYGKSIIQLPTKKITIEIKSLNSKNLDLNTRIPAIYREKEVSVRRKLAKELTRGKIDLSFYTETTAEETSTNINKAIVSNYLKQLDDIHKEADNLSIAMRLPDVLKTEREELDNDEWSIIEKSIDEALLQLQIFRKDEGRVLNNDFVLRIEAIRKNLNEIIELDEERLQTVRERLLKSINELKVTVDENRFEQEMIYYLEKLDITEEKVRLNNHLDYFITELSSDISNGKKLGFISQEMGREINTIGSKANFAPMQKLVVQMKDELEKIKEQLLNVL
ncbi:MAG: YicC family protein [Flavobacteriaceae bacterium]|nr:YicC family protein [Flavobacteriaceae bacterium]